MAESMWTPKPIKEMITLIFVRIDVAKYKHDIAMLDDTDAVLKSHLHIKNNREGSNYLIKL